MSQEKEEITYLLRQISEGNTSCFEKMYKRYFEKCYSIALYFVQSPSSAEDVLSEVFLSLWSKRKYLKEVKEWDSYLFMTVKNHAVTFLEKNQQQDNLSSIDQYTIEIAESELTPEEKLLKKDMEENMQQAIRQLPEKTRIVYCMVKEKYMSYKQISEILNISERTVNAHMTTAIRKLTESLQKYFG
ncbi:RNA polymerase sigma factor [uncultured Bacteroides sp.]|uniref:RNA polymerase sigma factor n=1 Tax=uncultured Bacteroides sp. TaxID=162156 RepID=UPI0025E39833|nr:RNA polymerase sigma-70 factor [uncultured Bacteroides sp.]